MQEGIKTAADEAAANINTIKEATPEINEGFDEFMDALAKSQEHFKTQQENLQNPDEKTKQSIKDASDKLADATRIPIKQ